MDQPLAHRIAPHWIRTLLSLALAGPLLATLMASPALARERGPDIMRQNISSATSEAAAPQIALGAGRMVAIWAEHDSRFGYTSTRPGDGWPKAEVLRTHALTRFQWPAVAVDGAGTVHLAYAANDRVYYQSQSASGEWSGLVQVGMSRQANTTRIVRALDGTLWIVWRDRDGTALFYRYSLDGGRSWHAGEDQGVVAVEPGNMIYPSIALGYDNLLHIVWYVRSGGPNQGEIRYADWTGTHFNVGRVTTDGSEHYDAEPAIVIDPQNVQHVVWRKGYANHWDIRYARRMPGRGWQDFTTIATTKADYKYPPSVATDELGNLFVSYAEPLGRDGQRIALRYKLGDGAWQSLALSTGHWDSRTSVIASIVTGSIEAHVVYQHQISGGGSEIVYDRVVLGPAPAGPATSPAAPPASPAAPPPPVNPALLPAEPKEGCAYVAETRHNLCGAFRSYWQAFGDLPLYGHPISEEFVENGVTVQYFERARFEYHPGAQPRRYDVLLGWLGSELTAGRRAAGEAPFQDAQPKQGCAYVAETRHNLCGAFRSYWQAFGDLPLYGHPISEEFVENGVTVQYFERARFEYHPGAQPRRYDVLLGWLGSESIAARGLR